jgi:hypothetical protein
VKQTHKSGRFVEKLSEIFERVAIDEFHSASPLYEWLSNEVAKDTELLALAAHCRRGERIPNLFFAAVHYLLLKGTSHPVRRFYKSLGGYFDGREDPYPNFRSFCSEQFNRIRELIAVRIVQTNEVRRCAGLMPLFVAASKCVGGRPLFIVDLGASAGLNLFWDQYGYTYGDRLEAGDKNSPVQIECAVRGLNTPPLPVSFPPVAGRVGVDLNPLDVRVQEDALWLRALVFPEQEKRAQLLRNAMALVIQQPLSMVRGDGAELLPVVIKTVPGDAVLCITRVFTRISQATRDALAGLIADYAATHDLTLITARPHGANDSKLCLTSFVRGQRHESDLAYMHNHGEWIEWQHSHRTGD